MHDPALPAVCGNDLHNQSHQLLHCSTSQSSLAYNPGDTAASGSGTNTHTHTQPHTRPHRETERCVYVYAYIYIYAYICIYV